MKNEVYVFTGEEAHIPAGIFTTLEKAVEWIKTHSLTGMLSKYPVDTGLYDWAINENFFTVKKDHQKEAKFIQRFTCASLEHFHFEKGEEI